MQQSLWFRSAGFGHLACHTGSAECPSVLSHAGPPVPTGKIIVRLSGGLMTDDVMGMVYQYLGHPPPFGKRSWDGDDLIAHCVHEIHHA